MSNLIISEEKLDIIIRRSMHELAMSSGKNRQFPDAHIDYTLKIIRQNSITLEEWRELEEIRQEGKELIKGWKEWKIPTNFKITEEEEILRDLAQKLAQLNDGELIERLGTLGTIGKKNGQYIIDGKVFKNAWKAAKYSSRSSNPLWTASEKA